MQNRKSSPEHTHTGIREAEHSNSKLRTYQSGDAKVEQQRREEQHEQVHERQRHACGAVAGPAAHVRNS